ncbi:MAG: urease accessory protein UreE [Rhizobiaceae bacterium]|nr:MAG: urease accessory protein UreE [Rhizobiaceae bacterium]CAG1014337.1 Urease accessory protein UreE 1 [Rhizobiaceae bacterium]
MKLSLNADFTRMPRAGSAIRAEDLPADRPLPFDLVVLPQDERHLRRRVLTLQHGDKLFVDLAEPTMLGDRDVLVLDDGRHVEIVAADEELYEIRGRDTVHLAELAWHIGNRHLPAQVEAGRILIARDHVIKAMLEGLGATVADIREHFSPLRGAYAGHGQPDAYGRMPGDPHYGHDHGPGEHHHGHHAHGHGHGHGHGEPDRFGRFPGDPHYGHDHA